MSIESGLFGKFVCYLSIPDFFWGQINSLVSADDMEL
jgi:hypothetical protein